MRMSCAGEVIHGWEEGGARPAEQYLPFQLLGDCGFLVLEDYSGAMGQI